MKDLTEDDGSRPPYSAQHCIHHALICLFRDRTKSSDDLVVRGLTFEELIGTLLAADDVCKDLERLQQEEEESI